ncbi:hypothetical protein AL542_00690 [Grimontia hollisae]|uniref:NAD-dependent formate dehydrogenase delta subunit n=2 Tax=Grimontia hollisae TaxID=673 RepID=D0I9R3_GRIHO|nr:formate dehydrogenase subunit delta [Grimontia hollisae]AMG29000.1 hypothetical protein AL542_00690 [Grimontia hollisae]EEY71778.1 hypothetical protein VHA_002200 [Grimontia hollisae CIP 101886]MDF2184812.1 formate dehydrogenase subunit delta [Grimontia hollisae]STO77092.1 NADH-dependant formate dehydrogenase delta subunit FdsD [Grimontia hollisae]STO98288.1 NADH-dependant formate dehydrogenase delta subunit FdsD [Grimontia hollisae]
MDGEHHRNERLFVMANQIAENLAHGRSEQETVEDVASHIRRFWSLDMKQSLFEGLGKDVLNPIAEKATGLLAKEYRLKAG